MEENKRKVQHWFFSTDLTFYIKGGRVTKTAGFVGTMLSICPLLHVNYEGKLIPVQKVRTKKKVIEAIEKKMEELAENGLAYGRQVLYFPFCLPSGCRGSGEPCGKPFPEPQREGAD